MDWPWWFRLGWVLVIGVVVARMGRWAWVLWRGQRDGTVDPGALWPPGRTERPRATPPRPQPRSDLPPHPDDLPPHPDDDPPRW